MVKFLDLAKQYQEIAPEINSAITDVIKSSAFIGGGYLEKFESEFASYQSAEYCIGVANGTDALEIAIEALDLPPGSEIIVPANSFIASSEAVSRTGHRVVFCDCNSDDYTLSLSSVESLITQTTAAVIAVHLYGHPCEMDPLLELAKKFGFYVIEDCAQAHGAEYKGHRVGAIGDVGCFSFYPGKNLGAYGDGGAITTNSEHIETRCRMIANHGRIDKYDHLFEGRNSRLDGMQAAVLSVKLKYLDEWTSRRIECAELYLKHLSCVPGLELPVRKNWAKQVYHLFVVRVADREWVQQELRHLGIQTGVHYPKSLPNLAAYDYLEQDTTKFFATQNDRYLLSLPMGEHLEGADSMRVVSSLRELLA